MKQKQTIVSCLIVAMALGTAWAVRGKFGHEQGAAWAGAIGSIALILVAKRKDWYDKVFKVALAAAFGWGLGGMISYGVVVGYGRADDFINAYYGLAMLFVIGSLYGFLGGGLMGLVLVDSKEFKVKWHTLLVEMLAGALLIYAFLINQLEWFMTPPRSELWAACLGASIALAWYILRNKQQAVMKVAVWSALGAGFGFAFGNFLQVLGTNSGLPFNFWNIMEYSIGFFGGLGMAYGTLTSAWPLVEEEKKKVSNLVPMLLLVVFIPFVLWQQSFLNKPLDFLFELGGDENTILSFRVISFVTIVAVAAFMFLRFFTTSYSYQSVRTIFIVFTASYTFLSFLLTGILKHPIEQYLYLVNIAAILFLLPSVNNTFAVQQEQPKRWLAGFGIAMVILAVLAMIAINSHEVLKGSHVRF
ncbi:MAG TPA: hypothetical protein VF141_02280 [Chryseolinea sp.]